tara:strand:+ start:1373 stop:4984 length:3612 start_codon:yes stop_codon:yes gene_type:complete
MPELDGARRELFDRIREELAEENQLSSLQARNFVRCLQTTWDVETIRWSSGNTADQLRDARRLIHAAKVLTEIEEDDSGASQACFRRASELLEWLTRSDATLESAGPYRLLAAASYQLAGLPAMARGLLQQGDWELDGSRLLANFLQADFDRVLADVARFWRHNLSLARSDALERLERGDDDDLLGWGITVDIVRCVGLIAHALRVGDDNRLDVAIRKLSGLDRWVAREFSDQTALLVELLYLVSLRYRATSIYHPLRALSDINPRRRSKLEKLARRQFGIGRGLLWKSQQMGLERLLEHSSFALCTPTGSGKTLVANMALIKELLLVEAEDDVAPLAIYLVPSRALAGEVEGKLSREMGDELIVTGLYGGNDWGVTDYWLNAERPTVLVATVEKADALMRYLAPFILGRLRLLIIDEAHQVVPSAQALRMFARHSERSLKLESLVTRIVARLPGLPRIALTAVAGGAAGPVARWMEQDAEGVPIGLNYRSTRQVMGVFETKPEGAPVISLDVVNGAPVHVAGRGQAPYINLRTIPMPRLPAKFRDSLNRFNQTDVLWTALQLKSNNQKILISLMQEPEQTMQWYCEALKQKEWEEVAKFEAPEGQKLGSLYEEALAATADYCGADSFEHDLLLHGIATSHGQMPQRVRRLMTQCIEQGICPITVATATLTEGVNLPFDIIFLTQLRRRSFDPQTRRPIIAPLSTSEFRNLAGRAGRPGSAGGMEGMTLISIPRGPSTTANSKKREQRAQISTLESDYRDLRDRLAEEEEDGGEVESPLSLLLHTLFEIAKSSLAIESEGEFLNWLDETAPADVSAEAGTGSREDDAETADILDELDGVLLSALEEIRRLDGEAVEGAALEDALRKIWSRSFSAYAAVQEDWMSAAYVRRGKAIVETVYPDADERSRLYQYGLTPHVGRRFDAVAPAMIAKLKEATSYGGQDASARISYFKELSRLLSDDSGYGFSVRATARDQDLLANWETILGWWLQEPDIEGPDAADLRAWQRFVSDNLEFRLGVALGAAVARAWNEGTDGDFTVPNLEAWKETTELPWFAFWARELLRWGTHEPFVAFCLAQGLEKTRAASANRRQEFIRWLTEEYGPMITSDDYIDPTRFLEWQQSLPKREVPERSAFSVSADLVDTNGARGDYAVIPTIAGDSVHWLDPAGYELARSVMRDLDRRTLRQRNDFVLKVSPEGVNVQRL